MKLLPPDKTAIIALHARGLREAPVSGHHRHQQRGSGITAWQVYIACFPLAYRTAFKYDDDLRHDIIGIFDEAQALPLLRAKGCRLGYVELSTGYRIKNSPCSAYECVLCGSHTEGHVCPCEPKVPGWFCPECGCIDKEHVCTASRLKRFEELQRQETNKRLQRRRQRSAEQRERDRARKVIYLRAWRARKRAEQDGELPTAAE